MTRSCKRMLLVVVTTMNPSVVVEVKVHHSIRARVTATTAGTTRGLDLQAQAVVMVSANSTHLECITTRADTKTIMASEVSGITTTMGVMASIKSSSGSTDNLTIQISLHRATTKVDTITKTIKVVDITVIKITNLEELVKTNAISGADNLFPPTIITTSNSITIEEMAKTTNNSSNNTLMISTNKSLKTSNNK